MSNLMLEMGAKAHRLGIPLSVQLDVTYRCNERCVHCYLDHDDHGEMTTLEIKDLLDQLADAGVFFLTVSGGEILLRKDLFEILEYARTKSFCIRLKTNALMIGKEEAARIKALGVETIQISIYSHRASVHDAITKVPGSHERSIKAIRFLCGEGLHVIIANVLMVQNFGDYPGVQALAAELGVHCTMDPTVTPMMDGKRDILNFGIDQKSLTEVFHDKSLLGDNGDDCAIPTGPDMDALESTPCSAGHTAAYVSPYGDVYPCVQFPLPTGNVRTQKFLDIWNFSPQMNEVRSITLKDLTNCSVCVHGGTCSRCPGLAYMEGNMRGPSTADCEKSLARTGVPSENLKRKRPGAQTLIQIHA